MPSLAGKPLDRTVHTFWRGRARKVVKVTMIVLMALPLGVLAGFMVWLGLDNLKNSHENKSHGPGS